MARGQTFVELAMEVVNAINRDGNTLSSSPWPYHFRTVEMARGARIIVEVADDDSIVEVPIEDVVNKIVAWLRLADNPDAFLTVKRANEVAQMWVAVSETIPVADIKPVRWKSDAGYTWRRLPWDRVEAPTPTWDKILGKLTNAGAFRQWLGSLLFEEAKQHQYVWIHGMGNDGKGSVNRFLKSVFGRTYRSKQPPAPNDKFWTYGLVGSRLVVFPDCNAQGFTAGGLFKSLTGGDPVDVEAKGRMSFTATLDAKFLFFSNEKPNISCEDADMRRIIYCEFHEKMKAGDKDPHFEKKLWDEGGAFLSRCVLEYQLKCPEHEPIVTDTEDIAAWISTNDERYQEVFDGYMMLPNPEYRKTSGLTGLTDEQLALVTMLPKNMLTIVESEFVDRKSQQQFRDWLYKKYGVQKKSIRRGADVIYAYVGACLQLTIKTSERLAKKEAERRSKVSTASTCR